MGCNEGFFFHAEYNAPNNEHMAITPAGDMQGSRLCCCRGSDIALCADLLVMGQNAKIGYPPARVWGCPTTAMWVYRLGVERAKRMLLSGDLIDGLQAERWGLGQAVPESELDAEVKNLAQRMVTIPRNQLVM